MQSEPGAGRLAGRTAVVSGASRGIGAAVVRALAGEGARVCAIARTGDRLDALAHELGDRVTAVQADVTQQPAIDDAARIVWRTFDGAPDILVNNAGVFAISPVQDTTADQFAATIDVNLVAPFRLLAAFFAGMRARGTGHIVTMGSVADRAIFTGNGAYAASKFGLRALHEVLRAEVRGTGVRTTLVSPSAVDTPIWDPVRAAASSAAPARGAMLSAEAVADAVVFSVTRPADVTIEEIRLGRS